MERCGEAENWSGLDELRDPLRGLLGRHCRDLNEIDDVIQETLLRAARYRTSRRDVRSLRAWTMRIALNVLSDSKRAGQRYVQVTDQESLLELLEEQQRVESTYAEALHECEVLSSGNALEPPWKFEQHVVEKEEALDYLATAKRELRAEDRRLLDSFYGGASSCRETAIECGVPRHLVKVRLFRARRRLLRALRRRMALARTPTSPMSSCS